jgi:hypothetical protein
MSDNKVKSIKLTLRLIRVLFKILQIGNIHTK